MNGFKRHLQQIALELNRLPFGRRLTSLPYKMALRALVRLLKKHPVVKSAWARNSFALGTWVPGRSDIDLTLILDPEYSLADELNAVKEVQKGYRTLQSRYPMLGELEIINEAHLPAWTAYSITGYEARFWLSIFGPSDIQSSYQDNPLQIQRDRLNHSISIYIHQMTPLLHTAPHYVIGRYTQKILRYLDAPAEEFTDNIMESMAVRDMQTMVLEKLDDALRHQRPTESGNLLNLEAVLGAPAEAILEQDSMPIAPADNKVFNGLFEAVIVSPNDPGRVYFITTDSQSLGHVAEAVALANDSGIDDPVILSRRLFVHYLHYVDPLEYLGLIQRRRLLAGNDPLESTEPCRVEDFDLAVRTASVYLLNFPYNPSLCDAGESEFRGLMLGWAARLARYFSDGVIQFDYEQLLQYWMEEDPDCGITEWLSSPDDPKLRFRLARAMADKVCAGLQSQ